MSYNSLLAEWKKRLGLQDWRIKLSPKCEPDEMVMDDASGCTAWSESIKSACIQILDPEYYGERIVPFDWEVILVHELLHLKLSLISSDVEKIQERLVHQIIDDLARAFVDAKRNKGG